MLSGPNFAPNHFRRLIFGRKIKSMESSSIKFTHNVDWDIVIAKQYNHMEDCMILVKMMCNMLGWIPLIYMYIIY